MTHRNFYVGSQHRTMRKYTRPAIINMPAWFWTSALSLIAIGVGAALLVR